MRHLALLPLVLLLACNCAAPQKVVDQGYDADTVAPELASTVYIEVSIAATLTSDEDGKEVPVSQEWSGSGVVYQKSSGFLGPVHSLILSAHHVLDTPAVGSVIQTGAGPVKIDAVLITVRTHDNRTCELKPLKLGDYETGDVATAEAMCDAGRVAPLATRLPPEGVKVLVTGHSLGFPVAIATEGRTSGWEGGFLVLSAAVAPGNSGGPIWYRGEVIGLLVRGSRAFPHIALGTPLSAVWERVQATPDL